MSKEKKLIKRVIKALISTQIFFIILFNIFICSFIVIISNNSGGYGGDEYLSDIGALGVPTKMIPYFNEAAKIFGIPNWVLAAVAKQESGFNPRPSPDGAYGLMQMQKIDPSTGNDLWAYVIDIGLGNEYKKLGYNFSTSDQMWNIFLKDIRAQAIAGGYEMRYYANYVLHAKGLVPILDYNNTENMKLINWKASESDPTFRELLRRTFACYNGGPGYGMSVNLDTAQNDYPNRVFRFAMEFRNTGLSKGGMKGDNKTIEKAIDVGMNLVGKSPYAFGAGRDEYDIRNKSFDCSSFVHYCYSQVGITLGDISGVTTDTLLLQGKKVNSSEMKRGDLIFFNTYQRNGHVGIYLGNGKVLNDNSTQGVWVDDLNNPYWKSVINGEVRRIIN